VSTPYDAATAAIEAAAPELLELSHDIHSHPEIGFEERRAAASTSELLEHAGFSVERGSCGIETAYVATFGTGAVRIGLCVEYDALPDVGHACGHNVIAASSVGAAIGLAAVAEQIGATVVALGTPAEEGGGGKVLMMDGGAFDGLDVAMMVHTYPCDRLEARCLAVDHFDVVYLGAEAHASAAPWQGVNASDAMTIAQVGIALLRQQLRPGDQVHGIITNGGSAANIIPARVEARYMVRSIDADHLRDLRARVNRCFEAGALATGATLELVDVGVPYTHMVSDAALLASYRRHAEGRGRRFELDDAGVAVPTLSTDMANVSLRFPAIHPLIGIDAGGAINHQPAFAAACATPSADAAVLDGAVALALTGIDVALDASLRESLGAGLPSR